MSQQNHIFFDASGKRRRYVNATSVVILILLLCLTAFTVYYLSSIESIANAPDLNTTVQPKEQNKVSLLYTTTNDSASSITSDQLASIDTLLVPRYSLSKSDGVTKNNYDEINNELDRIALNKPKFYSSAYLLSSKDYIQQPIERTYDVAADQSITELITTKTMEEIANDLRTNKINTLYLDINTDVINSEAVKNKFINWENTFISILKKQNLEFGLIVSPNNINQSNQEFIAAADKLYVTLDTTTKLEPQFNKIVNDQQLFSDKTTYEIPTISTIYNSDEFSQNTVDVSYSKVEDLLINLSINNRTMEPIEFTNEKLQYRIFDSISAYNLLNKLSQIDTSNDSQSVNISIADPGFEEYTTWEVVQSSLKDTSKIFNLQKNSISTIKVSEQGQGEIYSLISVAKPGNRDILTDDENQITQSVVKKLDTPNIVSKTGKLPNKIALTFDDGPHPEYTLKVLDILDEYNVKGTFFVVGENVEKYPSIVKEMVARGHEVENHSYNHPVFSQLTSNSEYSQIKATSEIIEKVSGQKVNYFRKPYSDSSSINSESDIKYLQTLKRLGLKANEYDIDSKDWRLDSADKVVEKVKTDINTNQQNYSQILLHDAHRDTQRTLDALPRIIEYLKSQDIEIVPVNKLGNITHAQQQTETTKEYRAITIKNIVLTFIVWANVIFVGIAIIRYGWLIIGASVYKISQTAKKLFLRNVDFKTFRKHKMVVIIACYNEEKVIGQTIQSLLDNTYKKFKIVVVNDGSTDDTAKIVKKIAKQDSRVSLTTVKNGGKSKALEAAIEKTTNKWVVFCDADTIFNENALEVFIRSTVGENLGAVAGKIQVGNDMNFLTRAQVLEYGVSHIFIKAAQATTNMITVVPGAVGLWNRKALNDAGGFSSNTLAEDADATMSVISAGYRVEYNSNAIARTEVPNTQKMLFKQRTRWQLGNLQSLAKHRKGLFSRRYGSLGFFGLPMFYLDMISITLFPLLLAFTSYILINNALGNSLIFPPNIDFATSQSFIRLGLLFISIEVFTCLWVILFEQKSLWAKIKLLLTIPYYLIYYKTFMSYSTLVSMYRALRGTMHGWGHLHRTASIK